MADLYSVLGVSRGASQSEIKSAYRRLALKYHPDVNRNPAAAQKFGDINDAYHVLIDPMRRSLYDRTGEVSRSPRYQRAGGAGGSRSSTGSTTASRAARRAYYQARADRIVNEWLQREREESRARGKAVYTTVTLFLSTFMVAMIRPSIFETSNVFWRAALVLLFGIGVWHLFVSLKQHFDHYTYRPGPPSVTRSVQIKKPFRRGVAVAFVIGGYALSITAGMLLGMLTDDFANHLFGAATTNSIDAFFSVFFYPPIAVLIVDTMYSVNQRLDAW
jgi:hypothetical protein